MRAGNQSPVATDLQDVEPQPRRRRSPLVRRFALTGAATLGLLAASTGVAAAHVSVSAPDAAPGGYTVLTFRVPTESATASTVGLTVSLPTDTPLASVSVEPVPGWTIAAPEKALPTPITTDDGQVTSAVTEVTWTAAAGGGLKPGQFGQFLLSVGPLPDVDQLVFPAVQTYSDGSTVEWIEQAAAGSTAEPEHPAPTLALSADAATDGQGASAGATVAASNDAASDDDSGSALGVTGVVLGGAGLLLGAAALFVALRRPSRRPAGTPTA